MSLLAPRPPVEERASVILPTVTCSSCSAPIPLSSLGEHICAPVPPRAGPRAVPRPSQLSIPSNNPSSSSSTSPLSHGASHARPYAQHPPAGASRPQPRPANLNIQSRLPSSGFGSSLPPPSLASPRTPSPTNPFFPHPVKLAPPPVNPGLGLGIGVGSNAGPGPGPSPIIVTTSNHSSHSYAADVPLSAVEPSLPDTTSGGESGMAGVGRRAFAAAAWGVRAGVALAATGKGYFQDQIQQSTLTPQSIDQQLSQSPQHQNVQRTPMENDMVIVPEAHAHPAAGSREPVILPKAPLSGRQRSGAGPHGQNNATPQSPPQRSATLLSNQDYNTNQTGLEPTNQRRQSSMSDGPAASQLSIHAVAAVPGSSSAPSSKPSFFDKYKQMVKSASSSTTSSLARQASGDSGPMIHGGEITTSPVDATNRMNGIGFDDVDDDQGSVLPWATPIVHEPEPILNEPTPVPQRSAPPPSSSSSSSASRAHQRYPTSGSVASISSSASSASRSGRLGGASGSGHETEVVVTPSQSWEGLAERARGGRGTSNGDHLSEINGACPGSGVSDHETRSVTSANSKIVSRNDLLYEALSRRDLQLEQIGEEDDDDNDDEGERLVFGAPTLVKRRSDSTAKARGVNQSSSDSTIAPLAASPPRPQQVQDQHQHHHQHSHSQSRSRTTPEPTFSHSSETSSSSSSSRQQPRRAGTLRICVKCGDAVGGSRRFVERDGVVLCEADWKKMYLPACRRCCQPIEKSAVSSSDGQLKGKWHRACFTCTKCDQPFDGDDFYVHNGKPWCQYHYHEENNTLCASISCRQPIEGSCILTAGSKPQRFHPGHLRCDHPSASGMALGSAGCREVMDEYYEVSGGRYCERHVGDAVKRVKEAGVGTGRAEKRMTRLVDLPRGVI